MTYIQNALLIYDDEDSAYLSFIEDNEYGTLFKKVHITRFLNKSKTYKTYAQHLLISCSNENIHLETNTYVFTWICYCKHYVAR